MWKMPCGWRFDHLMTNLNLPRRWLSALDVSWLRMLLSAVCMLLVFELTPLDVWLADGYFVGGNFVGKGNWWLDVFSHKWVKWTMILLALLVWLRGAGRPLSPRWRQDQPSLACSRLRHAVGSGHCRRVEAFQRLRIVPGMCCATAARLHTSNCWSGRQSPSRGAVFRLDMPPAGFALFGFVLLWRGRNRRRANLAWWFAFTAGFVLGWGQQMRGAHFLSHTLWSAWVCWAVCLLLFDALTKLTRKRLW
jgi:membrane-associated PAP2 superfamily phosphatase